MQGGVPVHQPLRDPEGVGLELERLLDSQEGRHVVASVHQRLHHHGERGAGARRGRDARRVAEHVPEAHHLVGYPVRAALVAFAEEQRTCDGQFARGLDRRNRIG